MGKQTLQRAGGASVEAAARAVMPWWDKDVQGVRDEIRILREELLKEIRAMRVEFHDEIRTLDAKVDNIRQEIVDKAEQHRELVNEVSHRVTRLDGKLEGYTEAMGLRLSFGETKQGKRRRAV